MVRCIVACIVAFVAIRLPEVSSRRRFLGAAGGAVIGIQIVPRHVLGGPGQTPPSEKLNIAGIGAGGIGSAASGVSLKDCA